MITIKHYSTSHKYFEYDSWNDLDGIFYNYLPMVPGAILLIHPPLIITKKNTML